MVQASNAIYNTVGATISGVTNQLTITNQSNTASSAARESITVGGTSAGNPTRNWNVNGSTDWEMGIDNAATQALKISQSAALGTKDTWIMTTGGQRTLPLQSSFFVWQNTAIPNVTGDSTAYTVKFSQIVFNTNSNYSTATGLYTAPVTGNYMFSTNIYCGPISAAHTDGKLIWLKNGTQLGGGIRANYANMAIGGTGGSINVSAFTFVNMTAGDTMGVDLDISNGTKTVGIVIPGPQFITNFSGCLVH